MCSLHTTILKLNQRRTESQLTPHLEAIRRWDCGRPYERQRSAFLKHPGLLYYFSGLTTCSLFVLLERSAHWNLATATVAFTATKPSNLSPLGWPHSYWYWSTVDRYEKTALHLRPVSSNCIIFRQSIWNATDRLSSLGHYLQWRRRDILPLSGIEVPI